MVQPSPMTTPGPNTQCGSTTTSRPRIVSTLKNTVSGAISVAPPSWAARRRRAWIVASAWLSCTRSLTPCASASSTGTTATERPSPAASATASVR